MNFSPGIITQDENTTLFNNLTDMVVILMQKIQANEAVQQMSQAQSSGGSGGGGGGQMQTQPIANNEVLRFNIVARRMRVS